MFIGVDVVRGNKIVVNFRKIKTPDLDYNVKSNKAVVDSKEVLVNMF